MRARPRRLRPRPLGPAAAGVTTLREDHDTPLSLGTTGAGFLPKRRALTMPTS